MSAILSPCGTYRYTLERFIEQSLLGSAGSLAGKTIMFVGVNPSTASASIDDPTVRKWIGFCRKWGAARFIVGNVFAYRAADVNELRGDIDPHGPENNDHLRALIARADLLVPCWGDRSKLRRDLRPKLDATLDLLLASGKPVKHFGLTKTRDPKHPLFLGYHTDLQDWCHA